MLHHITRDGSSPNGKQRVFFCAAPGQVKELFPKISAEIFEFCHCVIWYDDGENTPRQDLQNAIEMSSLAVLPVTAELFAPDSVVKRVMLPLVFSHRVTLLPILEDPNLLEPFNAQFKNIQLLDRHSVDATALPYREKLERFLDAALLRDELASQVKHAFSARIFLSYRKIDRQMARDLMRSVQREPKCRSIAFWYDEFLTPGEDFDKNIRSAIDDSDLFLLSLTENMLRAGNYVIREEYPYAHDTCKPILPVELEPVDLAQAARCFRDLPETVKQAQITNRLAALGVEHTTPQQDYLLGQAYLHGLQQERNVALSFELFEKSADGGYAPAALRLANLQIDIDQPEENAKRRLFWLRRYASLCQDDFRRETTLQSTRSFADAMDRLATELCRQRQYEEGFARFEDGIKLLEMAKMGPEKAEMCNNYGNCLTEAGRHREAIGQFYTALTIHRQLDQADPSGTPAHRAAIARICYNGALAASRLNQWELAVDLGKTAASNYRVLAGESPEDYTLLLAQTYDNMGIAAQNLWEKTGSRQHWELASSLHSQALQALEPMLDRREEVYWPAYGISCTALGTLWLRGGELEKALQTLDVPVRIFRQFEQRYPGQYGARAAGVLVNRASALFRLERMEEALADYREAREMLRGVPGQEVLLAQILWNAANIQAMQQDLTGACEAYRQALEVYDGAADESARCSVNYALCCHNYANTLYRSGEFRQALAQAERAIKVYEQLQGFEPRIRQLQQFADHLRRQVGEE